MTTDKLPDVEGICEECGTDSAAVEQMIDDLIAQRKTLQSTLDAMTAERDAALAERDAAEHATGRAYIERDAAREALAKATELLRESQTHWACDWRSRVRAFLAAQPETKA